ncbi:MAG: GTP-binding protein, partial [DPANN group archaeon]|nr:GTP-binding protein [DPANN group archaeon]
MTVMGHVDHGKTSLLDYIRGTAVAAREAGAITQHVGASSVPLDVIQKLCGPLLEKFKLKFTIPGLLFIDTPGHEVFTNLRKRGGSIADLAIVVIDIMQGIQPQTKEAIELLKNFKVPFVI